MEITLTGEDAEEVQSSADALGVQPEELVKRYESMWAALNDWADKPNKMYAHVDVVLLLADKGLLLPGMNYTELVERAK